jgi:hypothetical protein
MIELEVVHPEYGEITINVSYHYIPGRPPVLEGPADKWYPGEGPEVELEKVVIEGGAYHGEQLSDELAYQIIDLDDLIAVIEGSAEDLEVEYGLA